MDFLGQVNLFHGRLDGGRPRVASQNATSPAVQPVKMFARPFDLEIHRDGGHDSELSATVRRILSAGPRVKVELSGPAGEDFLVEMTHERNRDLALLAGDQVYLVLRDAKIFPGSTNGGRTESVTS